MKVSREQMAENREAILKAAGRLFRARGFESVGVAEVMNAAGFTHGGFYGHFKSKDDLIAETLAYLLRTAGRDLDFKSFVDQYLSPRHRDNAASGCPTAALAADTRQQPAATREALTSAMRRHFDGLSKAVGGKRAADRRRAAIGSWSAMLGAVILARAVDDPDLSDEILKETRAWIDAK
ncbi:MAG: helix-turn-helix domain-containing protein [Hyphomonadaceae bacterium]